MSLTALSQRTLFPGHVSTAERVDIVAYSQDATRFIGIQVKALSKRDAVSLGASVTGVIGDYWVIVNKVMSEPTAFILLPSEVQALANRNEKDGRVSLWLETRNYEQPTFQNAWERIGRG